MLQKRVPEPIKGILGKAAGVIASSFEDGDDFFEEQLFEPGTNLRVVKTLSNRLKPGALCPANEGGVRSIEDANFAQGVCCLLYTSDAADE